MELPGIFSLSFQLRSIEAAHAWAAKKGGDLTAYTGGQVSLNPWPHIKRSPIGMVVIPIISVFLIGWPFGFAQTPYDPVWAYNHPRRCAWMAVAGPAANLLLVLLSFAVIKLGLSTGLFLAPDSVNMERLVGPGSPGIATGLAIFISMLFTLNLILFILNLIPLPPLDGSGVIALFLHDDAARKYKAVISNPAFGLIGLLLAWQVFNPIFNALFLKAVNLLYLGTGVFYH